jgi:alkylation response protein AidB-like acyl-CoA dehydrogenase
MDLRFTPEDIAFRDEVRRFVRSEIPEEIRRKTAEGRHFTKDDIVTSHRILNAKGWATPHWPKEWGGLGWTPVQRYIFDEEVQRSGTPPALPFNVHMVGPVIIAFGNEAQKRRFLPATANIDIWWCQGFSEPGAGSDLAGLKTRAVRDGDHYVLNGQKAWTTLGQYADWMFVLARTDPEAKKQQGISFFLVDMTSPGITVRPTITIDGAHEVNEVFFDDVRVPAENLVGTENRGWDCAKFLLSNERTNIARIGMSKERIDRAKRLARETPVGDGTLWDDMDFRKRIARIEVELKALEITQMRVIAARGQSSDRPDPSSSILKIRGSEIQQWATELLKDAAGPYAGLPADPAPPGNAPSIGPATAGANTGTYFNYRKVSIYGGSNEIQRNIIAKAFLGL